MSDKIDMDKIVAKIKAKFKNDKKKADIFNTGASLKNPDNCIELPSWFQETFKIKGLPFGYIFEWAGKENSGKTSFSIQAMKAAQEQGVAVILADSEKKTTKTRLEAWGVNPDKIGLIQPDFLEEMFDGIEEYIEHFKDTDPDCRILVVIDSLGNTPSIKEMDTTNEDVMQLGAAAKASKRGFRRLVPRLAKDQIHMLVINQTYDNLGSHGQSRTGGKGLDFFASVIMHVNRMADIKGTSKGQEVIKGITSVWTVYKWHLFDDTGVQGRKLIVDITKDGISLSKKNET